MWRRLVRRIGLFCVAGAATLLLGGCSSGEEETTGADTSVAGPNISSETAPTSTPTTEPPATEPPTTEPPPPDYEAIYRGLHDEAVAFIADPLNQPSDSMNCVRNPECVQLRNDALDGRLWQGIGPDNLTVTEVDVLEEISPDMVDLLVRVEAEDLIEQVEADGTVVESIGVPTGAVSRVTLVRDGDDWIFSGPMDGRSWDRSTYEAKKSFSMRDPLDEPMTPTGEEGVTEDGVAWRTLATEEHFCLEAVKLPIGKVTRCISPPQYSDLTATVRFVMRFSGSSASQEYIGIWFGLKTEEGTFHFENDADQLVEMFPVDTSMVFDDNVEVTIGVSTIDQRPAAVSAFGPESESDRFPFNWPVPREEGS